jgi:hypothetical protein
MNKARRDGMYLVGLASAIFVLLGLALEHGSPSAMVDFKVVYYSARCLLEHGDPYRESDLLAVYRREAGASTADTVKTRQIETRYIYLPTAFPVTAPFAVLGYGPAHVLWMALTAGSFILASFLMWSLAAGDAPLLAGLLVATVLANSELLMILGNAAGVALSLCLIAAWCFLKERYVAAGVVCMAVSLVLKPQDSGLVWLYFLLAGGLYRRRALETLAAVAAISVPAVLWISLAAPHWPGEMRANMAALSAHGAVSDPGPASSGAHGLGAITDLQAVISVFRDDPRVYDPVSYVVCGAILLVWAWKTLRTRATQSSAWLALASVSALTMLPMYHRQYDAKLVLLMIPACAMLWAEGGRTKWLAAALSAAGVILLADFPMAIFILAINSYRLPTTGLGGELLTYAQIFPVPIILLSIAVFYLWVYVRMGRDAGPV